MKPYSLDLRRRVLDAYFGGEGSQRQLAARFRVSLSFVRNLLRLARETGGVAPRPRGGGHRPALDAQAMSTVVRLVRAAPDATLDELREQVLKRTGHEVSRSTMCRAVRRTGWRRKKNIPRLRA
jgi:transposase